MKIGILQTGMAPDELAPDHGHYAQMFVNFLDNRGFEFEIFDVLNNVFPDTVNTCDGWLITGSKHGAYEDHAWIPPLETFIQDVFAAKVPMVGVCFGHQIIAQALGGKVEKFKDGWWVGHAQYDMDGLDQPIQLNAWHQDQVVKTPPAARVVASNDFCKNAMLAYGDTIFTTQPHPEFGHSMIQGLIDYRSQTVPEDLLDGARQRIGTATQSDLIADMFTNIFHNKNLQVP